MYVEKGGNNSAFFIDKKWVICYLMEKSNILPIRKGMKNYEY